MIIGLEDGCLTLVRNKNDDEAILVLARCEEHILSVFPDCDIFMHAYADFQYRAFVNEIEVAQKIVNMVTSIGYDTFTNIEDDRLRSAYSSMNQECYIQYIDERI